MWQFKISQFWRLLLADASVLTLLRLLDYFPSCDEARLNLVDPRGAREVSFIITINVNYSTATEAHCITG